ncbi:hypothetical protein FQA39_LY18967 [Lamprigera yunnana]|nr:hypothetical protein FQA39_LY18967 [Lamprigera yunnana]
MEVHNTNISQTRYQIKYNVLKGDQLIGFENEREQILKLFKETIDAGESNSALLIGPRGIGKSMVKIILVGFGLTCRLDIIELFEKRVKSRFSHRQIFLFSKQNGIKQRMERVQNLLSLKPTTNLSKSYVKGWNKSIQDLIEKKEFQSLMQRILNIDPSEQTLKNMIVDCCYFKIERAENTSKFKDFEDEWNYIERDDLTYVVQDLSALELCLLIAIKHHIQIYDEETFNFEIILTRYNNFVKRNSSIQYLHRSGVLKAFEHLQNLELIAPTAVSTVSHLKEYETFKLLITEQQLINGISK